MHELHEISLSQGMYYSYFFHFYFGVRNNSTVSIVSNSSIVTNVSVSSVSSVSTAVASNRPTEALASVISFTFVVYSHYKHS